MCVNICVASESSSGVGSRGIRAGRTIGGRSCSDVPSACEGTTGAVDAAAAIDGADSVEGAGASGTVATGGPPAITDAPRGGRLAGALAGAVSMAVGGPAIPGAPRSRPFEVPTCGRSVAGVALGGAGIPATADGVEVGDGPGGPAGRGGNSRSGTDGANVAE